MSQFSLTKILPLHFFSIPKLTRYVNLNSHLARCEKLCFKFYGKKFVSSKSVIVILFKSSFWPIVNFSFQNLTRFKKLNSKSLKTSSFLSRNLTIFFCQVKIWHWEEHYFNFWHVVNLILFEFWHDLKVWKQKLTCYKFPSPKTHRYIFFSIQNLTHRKTFLFIFMTLRRIL